VSAVGRRLVLGDGVAASSSRTRPPRAVRGFDTKTIDGGWAYEHDLEPDWEPDVGVLRQAALQVADRWDSEYPGTVHTPSPTNCGGCARNG
jgi:hypothetical protein